MNKIYKRKDNVKRVERIFLHGIFALWLNAKYEFMEEINNPIDKKKSCFYCNYLLTALVYLHIIATHIISKLQFKIVIVIKKIG